MRLEVCQSNFRINAHFQSFSLSFLTAMHHRDRWSGAPSCLCSVCQIQTQIHSPQQSALWKKGISSPPGSRELSFSDFIFFKQASLKSLHSISKADRTENSACTWRRVIRAAQLEAISRRWGGRAQGSTNTTMIYLIRDTANIAFPGHLPTINNELNVTLHTKC